MSVDLTGLFGSGERAHKILGEIVRPHLEALAEEASDRCAEIWPGGEVTQASAAMAAVMRMLQCCTYSLGSTLASNGIPRNPLILEIKRSFAESLEEGYSKPGEGRFY